jgi:hypothetical protein
MGDGTIRHLEIKHGLPFLIRIEELVLLGARRRPEPGRQNG